VLVTLKNNVCFTSSEQNFFIVCSELEIQAVRLLRAEQELEARYFLLSWEHVTGTVKGSRDILSFVHKVINCIVIKKKKKASTFVC